MDKADTPRERLAGMKRRGLVLCAAAALTGCLGQARDESGPRRPPDTPKGGRGPDDGQRDLLIRGADVEEADDGSLTLFVTVENTSGVRQSDTLVGVATVGDTEHRTTREVSLDGNSEAEFALDFDVSYEEWSADGGLSYGWDDEL